DLEAFIRGESIRREREEIARGLTLVGPHRDDLSIGFASGYDLRCFASQGQQRTAALAMKLAAVDYLAGRTGEPPIVLLDDVLSEFDDGRKRALLHALAETAQTLITSTDGREFGEVLPSFRAFRVESGKVREEE
ncbi:MAG: DNA replication and repair protein RecF, partial [Firmicutes bacterium]|nr:DNA replication and repair protein RecF [Bacillota bacterium]